MRCLSANSHGDVEFLQHLTKRLARLMSPAFQGERISDFFGKVFISQKFFQHRFALARLQGFEGGQKNFRGCFGCTHSVGSIVYSGPPCKPCWISSWGIFVWPLSTERHHRNASGTRKNTMRANRSGRNISSFSRSTLSDILNQSGLSKEELAGFL